MLACKEQARPGPFTFEEYLAWEAKQEEKWELVDGYAVRRSERWWFDPATGMAGATWRHNAIVANLITGLNNRLRGGPCRAFPSDIKARSPRGNTRYPDVTVECGRPGSDSLVSAEPRVLIEVLSPSNSLRQQLQLLDDYQAMEAVQQIVFIEQGRASLLVWTRGEGGWPRDAVEGLEATLDLPSLQTALPLAEIYEGVEFDEARGA